MNVRRRAVARARTLENMKPSHETTDRRGGTENPSLDETVAPVFRRDIPNVDERALVAVTVTYPPGGASPIHRHAPSAFIFAYVLSGTIRSQVDEQGLRTYEAGDCFYEDPGSHHMVSENASSTVPATLLVVFVLDPRDSELTMVEPS
jgi:quercetin dioxygenase-like cupin family protein